MVIVLYYSVVLAWSAQYVVYSVTMAWGPDPAEFFLKDVLGASRSFRIGRHPMGNLRSTGSSVVEHLLDRTSWDRAVGQVLAFTVPVPAILLLVLCFRARCCQEHPTAWHICLSHD